MKTNNDRIFVTGEGWRRQEFSPQQLNFLSEQSLGNSTVRSVPKCFINFLKGLRTSARREVRDLMVQRSRRDLSRTK